ncbi:MAG: IclR family transcriptional regulator [Rhodospirillaceae bacterium]
MTEAVQSIERAVSILKLVASHKGKGARLADVVSATKLGKSTAHRLLAALVGSGLIDQDPDTRAYYLGYQLVSLGEIAANRHGIAELGMEYVDRLVAATGDTVILSLRQGMEAVCVDRGIGSYPIKIMTLAVGDRRPLGYGAGSLALLSFLPEDEVPSIIKANARLADKHPGLEEHVVLKLVEKCRKQGYARTDGRIIPGMSSISVPVLGTDNVAVAALSVAAISARLDKERSEWILASLKEEAESFAQKLAESFGSVTPRVLRRLQPTG